jgi:hypothetical protein
MNICLFAVILSFNMHSKVDFQDKSPSYQVKWVKHNYAQRFQECVKLLKLTDKAAKKFDFEVTNCDRLWVLATAIIESGLDNKAVSPKGARSSMQTYRKFAPKGCKSSKCDLRLAGIHHAVKYKQAWSMCDAATKYNAGPSKECANKSYGYAFNVMRAYFQLWEEVGIECLSDADKGC